MRSVWKGHIRFSLVTIPVRIYNALDSAQNISFNQLHKECNGRIGYEKRCKKCSETVPLSDIVKGYEYEPDQYVIVAPEDFDKIKLKSTRIVDIEAFVDAAEVHPSLFDSPYYAGPESIVAAKPYALLREALRESGKVGIGKVVLRDREDIVLIAPHDDGLILYKLRYPNEVRAMSDVPQIAETKDVDRDQLKLAHSLIDTMTTTIDTLELRDGYQDVLRGVIEAKVQGREIVSYEEAEQPVVDIMTALKRSIEEAKSRRKPMVKATGKAGKAQAEPAAGTSRRRKRA